MALERQTKGWAWPRASSVPNWKSLACPLSWEFKKEERNRREGKEGNFLGSPNQLRTD